jgi:hypothetical protein
MSAPTTFKIGAREFDHRAIVEVETMQPGTLGGRLAGPTYVGRILYANEREVGMEILKTFKRVPMVDVRSAREITGEQAAQRFHVGGTARICRYGNNYDGTVTEIKRSRITVKYRTQGDRRKGTHREATIPAVEAVVVR